MKYYIQKLDGVHLATNAQPWSESLDWVQPDPSQFRELGLLLARYNKCVSKDCTILGPVPDTKEVDAYDALYQPEPHYVSSYQVSSSQEAELPLDSQGNILQDSQDPYEDTALTPLSLSQLGPSQFPTHYS